MDIVARGSSQGTFPYLKYRTSVHWQHYSRGKGQESTTFLFMTKRGPAVAVALASDNCDSCRYRTMKSRTARSHYSISKITAPMEGIDMAACGSSPRPSDRPMDQQDASSRMSPFDRQEHEQITLPRADGGRQAWLFLAGSFMIEALLWGRSSIVWKKIDEALSIWRVSQAHILIPLYQGFPFSFGIFKQYYMDNPPFSNAPSGITTIGTSAMVSQTDLCSVTRAHR